MGILLSSKREVKCHRFQYSLRQHILQNDHSRAFGQSLVIFEYGVGSTYFILTPLNALPLRAIWSMNLPVLLLTLVQRLLCGESTCERFATLPIRP